MYLARVRWGADTVTERAASGFGSGRPFFTTGGLAEPLRLENPTRVLTKRGLADQAELDALEHAWIRWAESPDSFAAFALGRVIGRSP
jgi:hypothetical protein